MKKELEKTKRELNIAKDIIYRGRVNLMDVSDSKEKMGSPVERIHDMRKRTLLSS